MPYSVVEQCLQGMVCRVSSHMLSLTELNSLQSLVPTDEEVTLVTGFKGDVNRLGNVRCWRPPAHPHARAHTTC